MDAAVKYGKSYFLPPEITYDWAKKETIERAPVWCSVDLRDGNQALMEPMGLAEKLEFFQMLVEIGFKEIEVGFPAASDTEYQFVRTLIERDMIPKDVKIQVLTQAREHIIRKTFEAIEGAPCAIIHLYNSTSVTQREQVFGKTKEEVKALAVAGHIIRKTFEAIEGAPCAIIHLYNSTSVTQREQVFGKTKEEVKALAVAGAQLMKTLAGETRGKFIFEYSPESFPGTEVDYALEVCNAVLEVWKPDREHKAIINIPTTVQLAMPHIFACQVEYIHKNLKAREHVILSVHPHNDRGCGVSDAELGVLAGAERVEGTLFGNGERTGNVDLVTVAMNMLCHGVDSGLDFSDISGVREKYERLTGMQVDARAPYVGELVFTAFSGSHQDAISKGMAWRADGKSGERWEVPYLPIDPKDVGREYESDVIRINSQSGKGGVAFILKRSFGKSGERWEVPYLPIDPKDVGREYESDVIRINSQSGKGGVAFILKRSFGISLPDAMKEEVGYLIKGISDRRHRELSPEAVYRIFEETYLNRTDIFEVAEYRFERKNGITAQVTLVQDGRKRVIETTGNGRLDAISNAIKMYFGVEYELASYEEHAMAQVTLVQDGRKRVIETTGNGRLDAISNAIKMYFGVEYELASYEEHAISRGSFAKAAAYVEIVAGGVNYWGVGIEDDIISSSIAALVSAANRMAQSRCVTEPRDERLIDLMSYIQNHYADVTLEILAAEFGLSRSYLSKYIKEKSGMTFQEAVKTARIRKACAMLKETNQTVESIAAYVGYENVEHFNRLFKAVKKMTPIQFRRKNQ